MKVLYDITPLAFSTGASGYTGIGRAAFNVAAGLKHHHEIDLRFGVTCLPRLYPDARAVLSADPALAGVSLIRPAILDRPLFASLTKLAVADPSRSIIGPSNSGGLAGRLLHKAAFCGVRLLEEQTFVGPQDIGDADIFHSPASPLPSSLRRRFPKLKRFLMVYDLIAVKFPQWHQPQTSRRMAKMLADTHREDWILTDSESTRKDMLSARPDLDPRQVRVTLLAAGPAFRPCTDTALLAGVRARYGLPPEAPCILTLNTLEPRKNMEGVVRAFVRLVDANQFPDLRLVLAGGKGWKFGPLDALIDSLPSSVRDRIHCTGFVPDEDLPALYSAATVFAYPSHYEGFGLPPLEAMACGAPVVTSDNSSMPEVVGDAGIMVDSKDEPALVDALSRVLQSESLREQMSRRSLARAQMFSWERCVADTVEAYRSALS